MDYLELIEHSYAVEAEEGGEKYSRLEYLGEHIFDFTTYDTTMMELFAKMAVEVCDAITNRTTFDYIKDDDKYLWYLLMCNMPFFMSRLEWGSSMRGAWWNGENGAIEISSCGLWYGYEQKLEPMRFSRKEWDAFIRAVVVFSGGETQKKHG